MNDDPAKHRGKVRQQPGEEVPEPQIFRSRLFRVITWAVLILFVVSLLLLVVMAILPF